MRLLESFENIIWKLRFMWKAASVVAEANRNVLGMTQELANEVEKRIKLEEWLSIYRVLRSAHKSHRRKLKAELAELKQELRGYQFKPLVDNLRKLDEHLIEYKALVNLINKNKIVYEDNHTGDGIIAFDDIELAIGVVNLADALKESE